MARTVCQEALLNAVGGSVDQRVGLYPSQPLVADRFWRRRQLRPGRTAFRLMQAVTHQAPQVIQGHTAGPHQKGDEGMLQAGHAPSEVSLPGQFLVGGFALNVGLL